MYVHYITLLLHCILVPIECALAMGNRTCGFLDASFPWMVGYTLCSRRQFIPCGFVQHHAVHNASFALSPCHPFQVRSVVGMENTVS